MQSRLSSTLGKQAATGIFGDELEECTPLTPALV
jgi:hypothetical protein